MVRVGLESFLDLYFDLEDKLELEFVQLNSLIWLKQFIVLFDYWTLGDVDC